MILRMAAIIVGWGLLGAMAHATIVSTGGYGTPQSILTIAVTVGVGMGALVIGNTSSERRYGLALGISACLACGEAFGLLGSAERLVAQREVMQAPAREAATLKAEAVQRVRHAEIALASVPTSSERLTSALAAKTAADDAASTKATERLCAVNCRQILQQQMAAAAVEVTNARLELDQKRQAAEVQLTEARIALGRLPSFASGTPLADRLGIAPWVLDLLAAGLGSLAANGLGCLLLVFGAHSRGGASTPSAAVATRLPASLSSSIPLSKAARLRAIDVKTEPPRSIDAQKADVVEPSAFQPVISHVDQFAVAAIGKKPRGRATLADVHAAYLSWCRSEGVSPADPGDFAEAIGKLVKAAGITVRLNDKREPFLVGVRLKQPMRSEAM